VIRAHSAIPILAGFVALLLGLTTGPRRGMHSQREEAVDLAGASGLMPRVTSNVVEPA
jgi:hypothetical protein